MAINIKAMNTFTKKMLSIYFSRSCHTSVKHILSTGLKYSKKTQKKYISKESYEITLY